MDTLSMPLEFKGVVRMELVNQVGEVVQSQEQENVFFNQGLRNMIDNRSRILCITDSDTPLTINTTALDGTVTPESLPNTRVYDWQDRGHTFSASFAAPAAGVRTTRAVALAGNNTGGLAWAGVVLTTPIVQDSLLTLWVHYTIFVQLPLQGQGGGYWKGSVSARVAPNIFSGFRSAVARNLVHSSQYIGPVDESNKSWASCVNDTGSGGGRRGTRISSADTWADASRFKIFHRTTHGTAVDRSIGAELYGSRTFGTNVRDSHKSNAQVLPYSEAMIGRVWAKRKASTGLFFDPHNLPLGFDRAVDVRSAVIPYVMPSIPRLILNVQIGSIGGDVGTATYKLSSYENPNGRIVGQNIIRTVRENEIETAHTLFNKAGRQYFVSSCSVSWINRFMRIYCVDINMEYDLVPELRIRDADYQVVGDVLWILDEANPSTIHTIPIALNFGDSVLTDSYTHPTRAFERIHFIQGKVWCQNNNRTGWTTFDPVLKVWADTSLSSADYGTLFREDANSGFHDGVNNRLFGRREGSLWYVNTDFTNALTVTLPYVDNFSDGIMKNWGFHNNCQQTTPLGRWEETGGELLLTSGESRWDTGLNKIVQVGHYFGAGDFDVTCHIPNYDPPATHSSHEAGLFVMSIWGVTSHGTKSIYKFTSSGGARSVGVRSSTTGTRGIEATAALDATNFRFRITRVNNVIECYFSTDPIATSDVAAVWTKIGNPYTHLAGRVIVGMYHHNGGSSTLQLTCGFSEYRINSGNVDRSIGVLPITERVNAHQLTLGTVTGCMAHTDNTYFVANANGRVTYINPLTFDQTVSSQILNLGGDLRRNQIAALPGVGAVMSSSSTVNSIFLLLDGGGDNWQEMRRGSAARGGLHFMTKWGVWTSFAAGGILMFGEWGWNGTAWQFGHPGEKVTHNTWEDIGHGLQIRFNSNPLSPATTLNVADRYDFQAMIGVIKDNEQILHNFGAATYLGKFVQVDNEVQNPPYTTVPTSGIWTRHVSATSVHGFMTVDWDISGELHFTSGGAPVYWGDVLSNLTVTSIGTPSTSVFSDTASAMSNRWNVYKDMYVRFTSGANIGVRRKITEHDGFHQQFTTLPFAFAVGINDTFVVEAPVKAVRSHVGEANSFSIDESTGEISISTVDSNHSLDLTYGYVKRM